MKNSQNTTERSGLKAIRKKTAWPIWGAAAVWLLALTILPMHKISHMIIYAVLSAAVGMILDRVIPTYTVYVPEKMEKSKTGNAELDKRVDEINTALKDLSASAATVSRTAPSAATTLYSIISTVTAIRDNLIEDPSDLPSARRFLNYYLSTTVKLAHKYASLSVHGVAGENIRNTLATLEDSFVMIDSSLKKLLDAMFANDMLDISTDIEALNAMLSRDGIRETDPFSASGSTGV